jgi:hypothetical protein
MKNLFYSMVAVAVMSCNQSGAHEIKINELQEKENEIEESGNTPEQRFKTPKGYTRVANEEGSFAAYLRKLPLKPHGAEVLYYNGVVKTNRGVYKAVIDLPIGDRDLHQCADGVMHLYGRYLFDKNAYQKICFNFLSDGKPRCYTEHSNGVYTQQSFYAYMNYVYAFANTTSLFDQMKPVPNIQSIKAGDAFIEKKRPYGHAVIVLDVAENKQGNKIFMLAQSYMPAQELQVLENPLNRNSVWFEIPEDKLITPEWRFKKEHLRRFK